MRIDEIISAKILSKKDAMLILREVETGRGGIAELAKQKPIITKLSQQCLAENFGSTLKLFRAIAVLDGSKLKKEQCVSLTTDWKIAMNIAKDFPVLFGRENIISNKPHILRYDVPISKVLAYVPLLMEECLKVLGEDIKSKNIISSRTYDKIRVSEIVETGLKEKEVIADVTNLEPKTMGFEQNINGREWMTAFGHIMQGTHDTSDVEKFKNYFNKHVSRNTVSSDWEGFRKEHEKFADKVRNFVN